MASLRHVECKMKTAKKVPVSKNDQCSGVKCPAQLKSDKVMAIAAAEGCGGITKKASKLPVPIQKTKQNTKEYLAGLKSLTLADVQVAKVDAAIGTESEVLADVRVAKVDATIGTESSEVVQVAVGTSTEVNKVLKSVKEQSDLLPIHSSLAEKPTFNFYQDQLANYRGTDMKSTVKEIAQKLISDEVLQKYSYLGQRQKLRFKDYDNLTRLIISSTVESLKRMRQEIYGHEKLETDEEKKNLYDEIHNYFTTEYIKKAAYRHNSSKNK